MNGQPIRVLMVEDSRFDAQLVKAMLAQPKTGQPPGAAFEMTHVVDLAQAAARLAGQTFDVVLLDLTLPDAQGLNTVTRMLETAPELPVVVLTGLDDEALAVQALQKGAQDYLVKGQINVQLLTRAIRYAIERRRTEEALSESQQRYRDLIEHARDVIFTLAPDRSITSLNPAFEIMTGWPRDEWLGRPFDHLLHADDVPAAQVLSRPAAHTDLPDTLEVRIRTRSGPYLYSEVSVTPLLQRGHVVGILGIARDVTARRRMEQELQELNVHLEQRVHRRTFELQVLYELSQTIGTTLSYDDLIQLILAQLRSAIPHDVAAGLLNVGERGELVVLHARRLAPDEDKRLPDALAEEFKQMGGAPPVRLNVRFQTAPEFDDQAPPLADLKSRLHSPIAVGEDNTPIGLLFIGSAQAHAFSEDHRRLVSTVANQVAGAIQRIRAQRAAEEERLSRLVENLPEGVVLLDTEDRILIRNRTAAEILEELNGSSADDRLTQLGPHAIEAVRRDSAEGVPLTIEAAEPSARLFDVSAFRIPSERPADQGTIVVLRDVTELRRIEQQMQRQDQLAAIGQLAGGIAHDFNNVLMTIILYAELVLDDPGLPAELAGDVRSILDEARETTSLVRQMLDFSRRAPIETHALDLATFIDDLYAILQRTLPESIRVRLTKHTASALVEADPARLQQAVMNLVLNARDAMPNGGELNIELSTRSIGPNEEAPIADMARGGWACLTVADTGAGLSPEAMRHLYEPFFTTKPRGEGTGLGLAQAYGVVTQHGGHIQVETELGRGATFRIFLPTHLAGPPETHAPELVSAAPGGEGQTILVAEDEDRIRELCQKSLAGMGYRVLTAANGREALEVYQSGQPIDLLLTDMVMPEMGGKQLIRRLRELAPRLKVVAMTGYALAADLDELKREQDVQVVFKPLDRAALAQVVRQALDHRVSEP